MILSLFEKSEFPLTIRAFSLKIFIIFTSKSTGNFFSGENVLLCWNLLDMYRNNVAFIKFIENSHFRKNINVWNVRACRLPTFRVISMMYFLLVTPMHKASLWHAQTRQYRSGNTDGSTVPRPLPTCAKMAVRKSSPFVHTFAWFSLSHQRCALVTILFYTK